MRRNNIFKQGPIEVGLYTNKSVDVVLLLDEILGDNSQSLVIMENNYIFNIAFSDWINIFGIASFNNPQKNILCK